MPDDPVNGGPPRLGFFGKIPTRGDFVRGRLSRAFADAFDAWVGAVLLSFEARTGPDWPAAWARTRPWRFSTSPGLMGPAASCGVWVPSSDRVGRLFPLVVAIEHATLDGAALLAAEGLGVEAAAGRFDPEALDRALGSIAPGPRRSGAAERGAVLWRGDAGGATARDAFPVGDDALALLAP